VNPVAAFVSTAVGIAILPGGAFENHGTFTNFGTVTIASGKTLSASVANAAGGLLTGNGTISGIVGGLGTLKVSLDNADFDSDLMINGYVSLDGPFSVDLPVYGPPAGVHLDVNGTVTLSGSLSINVVGVGSSGVFEFHYHQ